MTNMPCDLTDLAECLAQILHDNRLAISLMDPAEPSECAVLARHLTDELDHEGWSFTLTESPSGALLRGVTFKRNQCH